MHTPINFMADYSEVRSDHTGSVFVFAKKDAPELLALKRELRATRQRYATLRRTVSADGISFPVYVLVTRPGPR